MVMGLRSTALWVTGGLCYKPNSTTDIVLKLVFALVVHGAKVRGGGGIPYNDLYGEAPSERGTFFRLEVYKRVGISQVGVYEMVGNSGIMIFNNL